MNSSKKASQSKLVIKTAGELIAGIPPMLKLYRARAWAIADDHNEFFMGFVGEDQEAEFGYFSNARLFNLRETAEKALAFIVGNTVEDNGRLSVVEVYCDMPCLS